MLKELRIADLKRPGLLFCLGWAAVMLSLTVAIPPVWNTFIHTWRVELTASIFLTVTLVAAYFLNRGTHFDVSVSGDEIKFIILPMCCLIAWSSLSAIWAPSWKSALHHSLIWSEYVIFYLVVRHFLDRGRNYGNLLRAAASTLAFFGILASFSYCACLIFGGGTSIGIIYAKYGEQVNTIFPLVLVGVLRMDRKQFVFGVLALVCLWLLVFCSLSRTNLALFFVGTLATAGVVFVTRKFRKYRLRMAFILAALVLAPFPLHLASLFATDPGIPVVNRLSDAKGIAGSNDFRKLMMSISFEMISASPVIGIGADNFGFEVNKYRAIYAEKNPDDPNLAEAEDTIPERAHNEYLQITAELGLVGAAMFLWFLFGIGVLTVKGFSRKRDWSVHAVSAVVGIAMFLASSLVTSYSFRLIQNGFVFFFVLAVAANRLTVKDRQPSSVSPFINKPQNWGLVYATGIMVSLLLMTYCTIRVASVAYETSASIDPNLDEATPMYERAMRIDDENPEAPYFLGLRLIDRGNYEQAATYLKRSIAIGKARSADFSYLASAQALSGDNRGAEETFAQAAAMYPQSPFVLTRYAALLSANGKASESKLQLNRAIQIDPKQAGTWWTMLTDSPQAAADTAFQSHYYTPLMDLRPQMSMYAVKAEREIRHPEEKLKF